MENKAGGAGRKRRDVDATSWGVGVLLQEPHQAMSRRFDDALDVVIPQRVCRHNTGAAPSSLQTNTPS